MVKSARVRRTQRDRAAGSVLPEDLALWEILYRLPAKELLRCRAVCRSWRRLSCDAEFLLAHHKLQPSLPLVLFNDATLPKDPASTVDAFHLWQSPAVRHPILGFSSHSECLNYYIHASCDGLLLLSRTYRLYYICNPTTRQWCPLPNVSNVAALYHHRPSCEYHILYRNVHRDNPGSALYCVLAVGASSLVERRCITSPSPSVKKFMTEARLNHGNPPVMLHDCLHWYYYWDTGCKEQFGVVVFDTVHETFRRMRPPVSGYAVRLSQMDGMLCIRQLDRDTMTVQVWVLQDYEMEVWSLKHRIQLPEAEMTKCISDQKLFSWYVVPDSGDMLLRSNFARILLHCDSKGNLVDKFRKDFVNPEVLQLSFKESLVRHAFFEMKGRKRVKVPGFFRGL